LGPQLESHFREEVSAMKSVPKAARPAIFLVLAAALLAALPRPVSAQLRFGIGFPAERSRTPLDGRLLLLISTDDKAEPRFQITAGADTQLVFGIDVDGLAPGVEAVVDASSFGYPLRSLAELPSMRSKPVERRPGGRDEPAEHRRKDHGVSGFHDPPVNPAEESCRQEVGRLNELGPLDRKLEPSLSRDLHFSSQQQPSLGAKVNDFPEVQAVADTETRRIAPPTVQARAAGQFVPYSPNLPKSLQR